MAVDYKGDGSNVSNGGDIINQGGSDAIGKQAPDNSAIRTETTNQPDTTSRYNYVNVLNQNIYEFMSHAYFGEGGFRDGSYLIPHTRELFYDERRAMVFYKNFVNPITDAMVDPVFSKPIKREVTKNGVVVTKGMEVDFLKDVDNAGTPMQAFAKKACMYARLHGVTFVVVDNHQKTAKTKEEAEKNREFPYVYLKYAYQVPKQDKKKGLGWKTDKYGNLIWITFLEGKKLVKPDANKSAQEKQVYSYYDAKKYEEFYINDNKKKVTIKTIEHGADKNPVIPVFAGTRKTAKDILISPPLYDISKVNHALFNKDSEIRDLERAQGFAVFYVPSENPGDMNIGAHNVVYPPIDSPFPPGFAAPPAEILNALREGAKEMRDDLFEMAKQEGVTGVQSAKTGVALEWEFHAEEGVLLQTSHIGHNMENQIMLMFAQWTGESFVYSAEYPTSLKPTSDKEDIGLIQEALDMTMPPKATTMLKRIVFKTVTKKENEDEVAEALTEFETQPEDTPPPKDDK